MEWLQFTSMEECDIIFHGRLREKDRSSNSHRSAVDATYGLDTSICFTVQVKTPLLICWDMAQGTGLSLPLLSNNSFSVTLSNTRH